MDYSFNCAFLPALYVLIPVLLIAALYRWRWHKPLTYRYSLGAVLHKALPVTRTIPLALLAIRFCALAVLCLLVTRPQLIDIQSQVRAEGVDIVLVIDVSQSMMVFDDIHDQQPRLAVVKREAMRFIEKRYNDPIALIIFGRDAIARCPLTLDKKLLKELVHALDIGIIDPNGTVLGTAVAMGVQRLKDSHAKSKIMILLTDGAPSQEIDLDPQQAIALAKEYGIKIYTIGVGGKEGGFLNHPMFGPQPIGALPNKELLKWFSQETGGQFFEAESPAQIKQVYETIDQLEKTEYETTIFTNVVELVAPCAAVIIALLLLELILATTLWFIL